MATPVYVTGAQKYVEFSPGHAIVNGLVLYINDPIRVNDSQLTDAPGGTTLGDYYVYLAPNRLIMESYYSKNWQVIIKSTSTGGPIPPTNPDEYLIAKISKTQDGSGNSQLACTELNRGARLIGSKDISKDEIIGLAGIQLTSSTLADNFALSGSKIFYSNGRMTISPGTVASPNTTGDGELYIAAAKFGWGVTPVATDTWGTISNVTTVKTFDANNTTIDALADVLGTLIARLRALGFIT